LKSLGTGSGGFIGSALVLWLIDHGDTVIGVDNHSDAIRRA
jgi:UDP-glucuronate 4-epimerase